MGHPNLASPSAKDLHPLHSLWRKLPAGPRRLGAARLTAWLAPRAGRRQPDAGEGLIVGGELQRLSGLGEGARIMLRACEGLGLPATGLTASLLDGVEQPALSAAESAAPLVLHVNAPSLPGVLLRLGRRFLRKRRIIGYWAWELPVVPEAWRPAISCVHEIWTPSRFSARALEPLLPGRVRVVPHALAVAPLPPAPLDREAFGLPRDAVIVLTSFSLASSFERKNPLAAVRAFRQAFGDRADRLLVLKIAHSDHYPEDMRRLRDAVAGAANIRVEDRLLPAADSLALTCCADIVLSLHRSEGFGLVPAEAMLLGRTVIATDWSATTEFLDRDCALPVSCRLVEALDPRGVFEAPGAVWAEADIDGATGALRLAADTPLLRRQLGRQAVRTARRLFSGQELAVAYESVRPRATPVFGETVA